MGLTKWEKFLQSKCSNCSVQFRSRSIKFSKVKCYSKSSEEDFEEISNFNAFSDVYGISPEIFNEKLTFYCNNLTITNPKTFSSADENLAHFPEHPALILCRKCSPVMSQIYKYRKIFDELSENNSIISEILRNDSFQQSQNIKIELEDFPENENETASENNDKDKAEESLEIEDFEDDQPSGLKPVQSSDVKSEYEAEFNNVRITRRMSKFVRKSDALIKNNTSTSGDLSDISMSTEEKDGDDFEKYFSDKDYNVSSDSDYEVAADKEFKTKKKSVKSKAKSSSISSEKKDASKDEDVEIGKVVSGMKSFGCSVCFEEFATSHQMKWHRLKHFGDAVEVSKHIKGPPFVCPKCDKSYKSLMSLQFHAMRKHKVKIPNKLEHVSSGWDCDDCCDSFSKVEELKGHHESVHSKAYFCKYCYVSFGEENILISHLAKVHGKEDVDMKLYYKPLIRTKRCKIFKSKVASKRPVLHYPCKKCHKVFSTPYKRKVHKLIHVEGVQPASEIVSGPPFNCPQCQRSYKSFQCLNEHSIIRHKLKYPSPVTGSCSKCDVTFSNVTELEEHCRSVHGIDFFCKYCNKFFSSAPALQIHESSHEEKANKYVEADIKDGDDQVVTTNRPGKSKITIPAASFPCRNCKQVFETYKLAKTHQQMHKTGEIPPPGYTCEVCGKWFKFAGTLYSHKLSHSNLKPHMCDKCGRSFKHKNLFIRHVNDHEEMEKNIRPQCKVCGKTFRHSTSLRRHTSRFHTGKSKPECPLCHKGFSNPYNVRVHLKICKATTDSAPDSNLENV